VRLHSYVVARDYGFAPNPFFGICTLATCKPVIRGAAAIGDWVVGTGSRGYRLEGRLVYAMEVATILDYDEYWDNPQYRSKRPNLRGSIKQAYGDNIYHLSGPGGGWLQANSHHSNPDGSPNRANTAHDTQTPKVLLGTQFVYWGASGPIIPARFRRPIDVCAQRGHKSNFPGEFVTSFVKWVGSSGVRGYAGRPAEFPN
jgi:Nucleotide modification associated domain 2